MSDDHMIEICNLNTCSLNYTNFRRKVSFNIRVDSTQCSALSYKVYSNLNRKDIPRYIVYSRYVAVVYFCEACVVHRDVAHHLITLYMYSKSLPYTSMLHLFRIVFPDSLPLHAHLGVPIVSFIHSRPVRSKRIKHYIFLMLIGFLPGRTVIPRH